MWQLSIVTALILTSFCLAAPQQEQQPKAGDGNLDELISSVFDNNAQGGSGTPSGTTPQGATQLGAQDGGLGDLISQVFNDNSNNNNVNNNPTVNNNNQNVNPTPGDGTILGVNNQNAAGGEDCECVPYYQCQNGTILEDGIGLIDIRSGFKEQGTIDIAGSGRNPLSGPCENYLDICCKAPNIVKPEDKITPAPMVRKGCGQRHAEGVGFRITGATDNEAQFGEFPWMVAVLREEMIDQNGQVLNVYQCGGALIHPQAVLTAAHCVVGKRPAEMKIRAGEWDTQTKTEVFPHQDRNVSHIIIHEDFHPGSLRNDYAILKLANPVDLAENVDVACLPEQGTQFDGSRCFASGWGKDVFGKEGHYQVILKRVELPIVPHGSCQNTLRRTRLGNYYKLHNSFICAGGEPGKDTCKGDGGSPLVCPILNDPTRYVQAGIVAWGIGCGENGVPGVYANVAGARRWIDEQIAYNNLDTTFYQYSP